jgi:hypothetical protein
MGEGRNLTSQKGIGPSSLCFTRRSPSLTPRPAVPFPPTRGVAYIDIMYAIARTTVSVAASGHCTTPKQAHRRDASEEERSC